MDLVESEREEGEIIDDELEDVSDCSISSPFHIGKSVTAAERLRSVSLSSISDSDLEAIDSSNKNGRYIHLLKTSTPKHHRKKRKRHERRTTISSSDSEDEKMDRKMLQQLKEAVRIDKSSKEQQNSLRTRLKGLIEHISEKSQTEEDEEETNSENKKQDTEKDVMDDKELAELRLEALKSAMLKKHFERKKRKALESKKDEKLETNKENTADNGITNENGLDNKGCEEKTEKSEVTVEEDVDIMRAMLLASMARKITEATNLVKTPVLLAQPAINKPPINTPKPIKRTIKNNYYSSNKIINGKNILKNNETFKPTLPSVEPLIIQVNNDSDSDMDIDEEIEENNIAKSVTEFLNQQRAEVEAKKAEKPTPVLDKSAMKLLPFSQQMEYQRLKQQLLAKKVKLRKISQNETRNVKTRTVLRSKFTFIKQNNFAKDRIIKTTKMNRIERNNGTSLQRTLSDMQTNKDGRLEVKGKYQELAPILKKVNQVSIERKRYENDIKRLLQELEKTKQKFCASHQNFKNLIEDLLRRKEAIDKRTTVNKEVQKNPSTPLKTNVDLNISELDDNKILPSSTPIEIKTKLNPIQRKQEQQEVETKTDIFDIVDPNDLNEHIMNHHNDIVKTSNLPKYVSPLDKRENDLLKSDPLAMLCPFDLLGVCKDMECTYKHCS